MIKDLLCGFVIGVANIIPGVSGGTFALILGLYSRLLGFINKLGPAELKEILSAFQEGGVPGLLKTFSERDYFFMLRIAIGAAVGIVGLSKLMKWLLENQFEVTYAFFFGLILLSVVIPFRLVKKWGAVEVISLVVGLVLTAGVAAGVDPSQKTLRKSEMLKEQVLNGEKTLIKGTLKNGTEFPVLNEGGAQVAQDSQGPGYFAFTAKYSASEYLMVFLAGIVAISAMVLPGISGSLVLILMGQYFIVVSALAALNKLQLDDLLLLGATGVGVVIGLLGFAKLLEYLLNHFRNQVVAFLTGLVFGSLYALWPFKSYVTADIFRKTDGGVEVVEAMKVYTNQLILAENTTMWISCGISMIAGVAIMIFFVRQESEEM